MRLAKTICLAGVAIAGLLAGTPADAADKVQFRLNWILYGFHTPFYLGLERGYYTEEGIDLTIGEGQGSVRAVQTVGAKGDDFGLSDGGSVVAGATKGAPVKAVMAITNSSPYALSVRADIGIKTLKDVEGKTIASAPGEAGLQLLPGMLKRGQGGIVNVSSISGTLGTAQFSAYCASKWGLNGFTKALAEELKGTGVKVFAVLPGSTDTDMLRAAGFTPVMKPEDVAGVVRYLCSDAPLAMSGSLVEVFG